jgi:hypothetical protein
VWNDHASHTNTSNQQLRSNSPIKTKLPTSVRRETFHEGTAATIGKSIIQIPSLSSSPQHTRDDMNNDDLVVSTTTKSFHPTRRRHTNSLLEKSLGTADYNLLMRKDSYRSSQLNNNIRPQQISSKDRNYVMSKTSFYEVNEKDLHLNGTSDENINIQQQQQTNSFPNTQRLYASTFDLPANKNPFSPNKSRSFNIPATGTVQQHDHYNSTQEFSNNDLTHFADRGTISKEQIVPTTKSTATIVSHTPGERHPSAQSYESRDPNKSYAYTDVKKYIEENGLMSPEKEQTIQNWIIDIEKHRHELQKIE